MDSNLGILVVHGIGSQQRGESLYNCLHDLVAASKQVEVLDVDGNSIHLGMIRSRQLDRVTLRHGCWQVRFYEVHWAPVLDGANVEGTFHKFLFEETTWFPWLNWRSGVLPSTQYSTVLVLSQTARLWLLGIAASCLNELVGDALRRKYLDQICADVTNYAHSMVGDLSSSSQIKGASEEILARFRETAALAVEEGCRELQVVAHSLGTVIAFNAMTRYGSKGMPQPHSCIEADEPVPITRFYTVGSPLEKFRFIWTRVIIPCKESFQVWRNNKLIAESKGLIWHNFYSLFDVVSGRLVGFAGFGDLRNKHISGLGGLANAHVSYFANAAFLNAFADGIGVPRFRFERPLRKRIHFAFLSAVQSLALPILLVLALASSVALILFVSFCWAGLTGLLMIGALWIYNIPLSLLGLRIPLNDFLWGWIVFWSAAFMPLALLFFTKDGYARSLASHQRHWRRTE